MKFSSNRWSDRGHLNDRNRRVSPIGSDPATVRFLIAERAVNRPSGTGFHAPISAIPDRIQLSLAENRL
jgi:hypothetical protein